MNVSPAQRLVSYLREFPLVRPATSSEAARVEPAPAPPTASVERPPVAERRAAVTPLVRPVADNPAPGPRLPRGTLLNIVT